MGNYPMGAEYDKSAPYNEPLSGASFDCYVDELMIRRAKVETMMYDKDFMGYDEDGNAIVCYYPSYGHPDEEEYKSQYKTIEELLDMLVTYLENDDSLSDKKRKRLINECKAWESKELNVDLFELS